MSFVKLTEIIGFAGFIIWAMLERGFFLSGRHQAEETNREQGSFWLISIFWYVGLIYAILDAWSLGWTTFDAVLWPLRILGILLTGSGLVFRFLARSALGKQYSVHVATSERHELVTKGIYRLVRHPAYLGLLCLFLGIPLCEGSWAGLLVALFGGIPVVLYRISIEEKLLAEWFGEQYRDYEKQTYRLIPYIW